MTTARVFAIVPAAGVSSRMGQHKLLLPWDGRTLIDCVLEAWTNSLADHVVVIIRHSDTQLRTRTRDWPVDVIRPETDPRDMKESVQLGLLHIMDRYSPNSGDSWMVAPADLPRLGTNLIDQVIAARGEKNRVVAPRFGDRQGHPVLLPWELAARAFSLGENEGINRILSQQDIVHVDFPAESRLEDVDTPEDYRRLST